MIVKIDDKYSVEYDDKDNGKPVTIYRNGEPHGRISPETPNWAFSLLYAFREVKEQRDEIKNAANAVIGVSKLAEKTIEEAFDE